MRTRESSTLDLGRLMEAPESDPAFTLIVQLADVAIEFAVLELSFTDRNDVVEVWNLTGIKILPLFVGVCTAIFYDPCDAVQKGSEFFERDEGLCGKLGDG